MELRKRKRKTEKEVPEADTARIGQENASGSAQGEAQNRIRQEMAGNYYTGEYETLLDTAAIDKRVVIDRAVYYHRWYVSGTKIRNGFSLRTEARF